MNQSDLDSAIRSVTDIAVHFEQLKAGAIQLATRVDAQRRGYFTPDEEDDMRALLVSYTQARNALFELIAAYRADEQLPASMRPAAFLTAFGAALLLVDAGRFLRERFHERPVIRHKLNEAAPEFGIQAGVYDRVQQSLFSARHAWHLLYALKFYEQHAGELQAAAAQRSELRPVLEIVDRLKHRLDVSVRRFTEVKLRTRGAQWMRRIGRDLFGRSLYGLQQLGCSLMADKYVMIGHAPRLPEAADSALREILLPGDVIVVRKEYALTNYFLPGHWPHAALYLGDGQQLRSLSDHALEKHRPHWLRLLERAADDPLVLESMKDGVRLRSLRSPFASDSVVVMRSGLAAGEMARAIGRVLAHEDKPYDFDFDFRCSNRLVCTEVVYRAYDGVGDITLPLTIRAGRPTLSGSDLIRLAIAGSPFRSIAVFAPQLGAGLAFDEHCPDILRAGEKI